LTSCPFKEEYAFNSLRKNAIHKSGENKKEVWRNTQSASRRTSGILRSCEMCKCISTENVLINISHRRLPEETLPPSCATYNSPHIFAPPGISISHHGAFLIDTEKRRNERIECVWWNKKCEHKILKTNQLSILLRKKEDKIVNVINT